MLNICFNNIFNCSKSTTANIDHPSSIKNIEYICEIISTTKNEILKLYKQVMQERAMRLKSFKSNEIEK